MKKWLLAWCSQRYFEICTFVTENGCPRFHSLFNFRIFRGYFLNVFERFLNAPKFCVPSPNNCLSITAQKPNWKCSKKNPQNFFEQDWDLTEFFHMRLHALHFIVTKRGIFSAFFGIFLQVQKITKKIQKLLQNC